MWQSPVHQGKSQGNISGPRQSLKYLLYQRELFCWLSTQKKIRRGKGKEKREEKKRERDKILWMPSFAIFNSILQSGWNYPHWSAIYGVAQSQTQMKRLSSSSSSSSSSRPFQKTITNNNNKFKTLCFILQEFKEKKKSSIKVYF